VGGETGPGDLGDEEEEEEEGEEDRQSVIREEGQEVVGAEMVAVVVSSWSKDDPRMRSSKLSWADIERVQKKKVLKKEQISV
jgi:hypothetical protein